MKAVDLQINLLPWRQKRREYQQRQLLNALTLVALVGGFLLVVWWQIQSSQIAKQDERNALLKAEIEVFEGKIREIRALISLILPSKTSISAFSSAFLSSCFAIWLL